LNNFPELLTNDKINNKKVLTTIIKELKQCDEFMFSVAFVTKSGIIALTNVLEELNLKNTKGKILVSQYQNFTQPEALKMLLKFPNIILKIVVEGNFHAKGYLFKKENNYDLIIGSSNLTASALCENKEWNLKITESENSLIIQSVLTEFNKEFEDALTVNQMFIDAYESIYNNIQRLKYKNNLNLTKSPSLTPNKMQSEALINLKELRNSGKNKALLISATGTGKTYLSAFDVLSFNPKKFLFVVHRLNIANAALKSFKKIIKNKTFGIFSGETKEIEADCLFATIQTISKEENLKLFNKNHFDYIVIDETHRAGAKSYQNIIDWFTPKFLLGMTATPERTDGFDIFKQFEYNIAYEIRLQKALEENMLCPFHYFGVTDISVDNKLLDDNCDFNSLVTNERIEKIIEKSLFYGSDSGIIRGLIFCSKTEECNQLSKLFNEKGFKTVSLTGKSSEEERAEAIKKIQSENFEEKIDYIFTVDIFNEGVDIPKINQIIMLRPTQSAIVFVQQLGRGLRKAKNKEYLTVIDFIGNYSNNYLVPIALFGDTSYSKDSIRKFIVSGNSYISGSSTVNFDKIAKEKIFESIDKAKLQNKKDLTNDYKLLKFKIGKIPMMVDFLKYGARNPSGFVETFKSYYNFINIVENKLPENILNDKEIKMLEFFSSEVLNGKRAGEIVILKKIIEKTQIKTTDLQNINGVQTDDKSLISYKKNINFEFVRESQNNKLIPLNEKYNLNIISYKNGIFSLETDMINALNNKTFNKYFIDLLNYSEMIFNNCFDKDKYYDGFVLYEKYTRKDIFRILNWDENPVALNVGGYIISKDKTNCPIFINYHKREDILYDHGFIGNSIFKFMSKGKRTLKSPDVVDIVNSNENNLNIYLFVRKSEVEGNDYYFTGKLKLIDFKETTLNNSSIVQFTLSITPPVEETIYDYLVN